MESASSPLVRGIVDNPAVVLHSRIASPLGIEDGDDVMFELVECGERIKREITVSNDIPADFMVNDAMSMELAIKAGIRTKTKSDICTTTTNLKLTSEREIQLPGQDLWGVERVDTRGCGILHFNGASRKNGSAGFGYSISSAASTTTSDSPTVGPDLVTGYCYCGSGSNQEMEYAGLLEALEWAVRFDFATLWIRGDSQLVIQRVRGDVEDKEDQFVEYFYNTKIQALLEKAIEKGTDVAFEHVPKEANVIANVLANLAIDLKENATACNWDNINQQCRCPSQK